jgi:hypothetical protein
MRIKGQKIKGLEHGREAQKRASRSLKVSQRILTTDGVSF